MSVSIREFESGASRNSDEGKLDHEGFNSYRVVEAYGEYMHKNRFLENGQFRDSDNWQKGIPVKEYMKSMWRHFFAVWKVYRGGKTPEDQIYNLCALKFNVDGMLDSILKAKEQDGDESGAFRF